MPVRVVAFALAACAFWTLAEAASILGVAPNRTHLVAPGAATSFLLVVTNEKGIPDTLDVKVETTVPGWDARLFPTDERFSIAGEGAPNLDVTVDPGESHFLVLLRPPQAASGGAEAEAVVSVVGQSTPPSELRVRARVSALPKVYFVALDGCGANYLKLDRRGRLYDGTAEPLMPRAREFIEEAAFFPNATAYLPTATDPDHMSALSGSWPGTLGIYSVNSFYAGVDPDGEQVLLEGSSNLLRWGAEGKRIQTIYDVLKNPADGGDSEVFNAFIAGKEWVGNLLHDDGAVDVVAGGIHHPDYFSPPRRSPIGDPPSDTNPILDRNGTNPGPRWLQKRFNLGAWYVNRHREDFPDDDWIAESTARLIAVEDPDSIYTLLADCDTGQHLFGSADTPEEWTDPGTPGVLWDDVSRIDPRANRESALDVVHEADRAFGVVLDTLRARETYDHAFVVLLADHGLVTMSPGVLDLGKILSAGGVSATTVERIISAGQLGFVYLSDPSALAQVEDILESFQILDPTTTRPVHPFIVLNRSEMDSGIDGVEGSIAEDGVTANRRGELYSEWTIDVPSDHNDKVRWPDLFVFDRSHFQNVLTSTDNLGGQIPITLELGHHGSLQTSAVPLAIRGPGVVAGTYESSARLADITPTLYRLLGLAAPEHVDGRVLEEILATSAHPSGH